ncbi:MAG: hypothetical protein HYU74_12475 [Dechloromonas sp.]|nr:hypothetical protein [Dechloromonas sp.]
MIPFVADLAGGTTIKLIVAGLALVGAALGGASLMADHKDAEISRINEGHQADVARNAQAALARLASAQRRGDDIQTKLTAAEAARTASDKEKDNAIRRLTVGRPCLDGAAVRLLNEPAGLKPAAVPEAAGEPAGDAAGFATDTDVGLWIGACKRGYDTCRGRLQAVADFFREDSPE